MNGYVALFNGKRIEVYAETLYEAKQKAFKAFKPRKREERMISVVLAEKDGEVIVHTAVD